MEVIIFQVFLLIRADIRLNVLLPKSLRQTNQKENLSKNGRSVVERVKENRRKKLRRREGRNNEKERDTGTTGFPIVREEPMVRRVNANRS